MADGSGVPKVLGNLIGTFLVGVAHSERDIVAITTLDTGQPARPATHQRPGRCGRGAGGVSAHEDETGELDDHEQGCHPESNAVHGAPPYSASQLRDAVGVWPPLGLR